MSSVKYCPPENHYIQLDDKHLPLYVSIAKELKVVKGIIASTIIHREQTEQTEQTTNSADLYSMTSPLFSKRKVDNATNWLVHNGYLYRISPVLPRDAKALLCRKPTSTFWEDHWLATVNRCEWCKSKAPRLHNHHYPIPKVQGGKDTVKICPACHDEFHFMLEGKGYKITQKLYDLYTKE